MSGRRSSADDRHGLDPRIDVCLGVERPQAEMHGSRFQRLRILVDERSPMKTHTAIP